MRLNSLHWCIIPHSFWSLTFTKKLLVRRSFSHINYEAQNTA
ncbi:hypothetical protein HMPREF3190_00612 [Umbribacter vaginalis]|nr:hypothetical protein HMPREF3190_00612 [Coriobacteriales bacterium DNF00809]